MGPSVQHALFLFLMSLSRAVFSFCLFDAPVLGLFARLSVGRVFFFVRVVFIGVFSVPVFFGSRVWGAFFGFRSF